MKFIIIIQARMGSSRLPGKVLMKLGANEVLDYVVSRSRKVKHVEEVIVATSSLAQDDLIAKWCEDREVACFRGSEDDVLSRYYNCAKTYSPDYVIRITADCPFLDYQMANEMVDLMEKSPCDIILLQGELPRGLAVELISYSALSYIYKYGHELRHREHVTYYAYEHIESFTKSDYLIPDYYIHPELRITLDTEEDLMVCRAIAEHFGGDKEISSHKVIDYLIAYPEIAEINLHVQQKPVL